MAKLRFQNPASAKLSPAQCRQVTCWLWHTTLPPPAGVSTETGGFTSTVKVRFATHSLSLFAAAKSFRDTGVDMHPYPNLLSATKTRSAFARLSARWSGLVKMDLLCFTCTMGGSVPHQGTIRVARSLHCLQRTSKREELRGEP